MFSYLYLVCGFKIRGYSDMRPRPAWLTIYRVQVSPEKDFRDDWNSIKVWFLPMSCLFKFPFFFHLNMPSCGDRVWQRQVELLTSQLWYFNVCFLFFSFFFFFFFCRGRNYVEAHQPLLWYQPVSFVICMKVETHGYPYVCKYSILLFFFDDRNSVYDRIMLAPSFPNVTLYGKRVLNWTHITMTRSAIGSEWNDSAASEQRDVRWHD